MLETIRSSTERKKHSRVRRFGARARRRSCGGASDRRRPARALSRAPDGDAPRSHSPSPRRARASRSGSVRHTHRSDRSRLGTHGTFPVADLDFADGSNALSRAVRVTLQKTLDRTHSSPDTSLHPLSKPPKVDLLNRPLSSGAGGRSRGRDLLGSVQRPTGIEFEFKARVVFGSGLRLVSGLER